jgi:hypothetical protein
MARSDYFQQILERHGIEVHTDLVRRELDVLRQQPGSVEVLRKLLTSPASEQNAAPSVETTSNGDGVNLQASLQRLEYNLDRLEHLIGDPE